MPDKPKPSDPHDLLQENWPDESEGSYLDMQVDLQKSSTLASEGASQSHRDAEDIRDTFIGRTGTTASEGLTGDGNTLDSLSQSLTLGANEAYSVSAQITTTKTTMTALVTTGTTEIDAALEAEKEGEEPPNGKSSDTLISEYREAISNARKTFDTTLDAALTNLSGDVPEGAAPPRPKFETYSSNEESALGVTSPEKLSEIQQQWGVDLTTPSTQPTMPAAVPEGSPSPSPTTKSPSLPGNPFSPQAPTPQAPSAPSMPTSPTAPTAEAPTVPTAPTGTESPSTTSPESTTTGNPSQTHQESQTAPSPASLADYAGSAATNAADLTTAGLSGIANAATDSVAPVVAGIAPTIAQGAPGAPIAAPPITPTGLTPGTPMAPVGLGGIPPAAQAPTPTAAPVAGTAPAPAPAPGQGVVAHPPGVPGSPPAPGQGLVTSAWLHDRYGTPLPADAKDAAASPSFFLGMPEDAVFLHKILATLRHQFERAGWDQPLAIASIRQGLDKAILFVTADGVSLHPSDVLLPDGVTPLSELVSSDRTHRLMGSISVADKARLVSTEGWEIGLVVATHGRQGEGVHIQSLEDYTEIVRSESLLPAVVSRGVPDATQETVMNGFALASVGTKIVPGDPEILAGQIQALRWVVEQPIEYLDLYRRLMVSEGFAAMSREDWQDSAWAFSQVLSVSPVVEGAVK